MKCLALLLGWLLFSIWFNNGKAQSARIRANYERARDSIVNARTAGAIVLLQQALYWARRPIPPDTLAAYCGAMLAYAYAALGRNDSAKYHYQQALAWARRRKNDKLAASILNNLAALVETEGDFPLALNYYKQIEYLLERMPGSDGLRATVHLNVGALYFRMNDTIPGLTYTRRSIAVLERCRCDSATLANAYYNLAGYSRTGADRLAYYHRAYDLARASRDYPLQLVAGANLSRLYLESKQLALARQFLDTCQALRARVDQAYHLAMLDLAWGWFALVTSDLQRARTSGQRVLTSVQAIANIDGRIRAHDLLYKTDSARGDLVGALTHYKHFRDLKDSLRSEAKARRIGRLEAQYAAQKEAKQRAAERAAEQVRAQWTLGLAVAALVVASAVAFFLFRSRNRERRSSSELRRLYDALELQRIEIEAINAELRTTLDESRDQERLLTEQHEKIEDSFRYASRIQYAILPAKRLRDTFLPPHFIYYQPRDIISGDFYWLARTEGKSLFATVDCTGHGVPGAFMSVMGHNLLNQIVNEMGIDRPATILKSLDSRIVRMLGQESGLDSMNGMDVCLVVIHDADAEGRRIVEYAGAGRPLWVYGGGQITEYRSARYSCGGTQYPNKIFPATRIELGRGARLYLFSDGVTDQFGGEAIAPGRYRKLGRPRLKQFLCETAALSLSEQQAAFVDFFTQWMSGQKQLDDVLLAAIEL